LKLCADFYGKPDLGMDDETASSKFGAAGKSGARRGKQADVAPPATVKVSFVPDDGGFNEEIYLKFNPDVRQAVAAGAFASGRDHFNQFGRAEGRPYKIVDRHARNRVLVAAATRRMEGAKPAPCAVESIRISTSGGIFIIGWANDAADPVDSVELYFIGWSVAFDGATLARCRRVDVEAAMGTGARHHYGFWGFLFAGGALKPGPCTAIIRLATGAESSFTVTPTASSDHELRKITLGYLATTSFYGNQQFAAVAAIEHGIGQELVALNHAITPRMLEAPYVQRFGSNRARYRGSFVVCLYGKAEYMFLQTAMFARQAGIEDYEFIYVCNSPQLGETLLQEAQLCARIYGIDLTVAVLAGNAGFGAANNFGARLARSDRLLITNPDVLPHDPGWITKHAALIAELPAARTDLFGAPLYYDNGSLSHAGMHFETDTLPGEGKPASLLRVVHTGKGAPPETASYLQPRPVPAVAGAFMSINRAWFEKLGGFSQDFIFAGYEDADLCLKSVTNGRAPWLHDIKLWHLEGSGSTRLRQHDGGAIVNRWLFTQAWAETVAAFGPAPSHPGFTAGAGLAPKPARQARRA
jgi:GT2 family glycosyltransferase